MTRPSMLLAMLGLGTAAMLAAWVLGSRTDNVPEPSPRGSPAQPASSELVAAARGTAPDLTVQTAARPSLRVRLRGARDYSALFAEIAPAALAGDPEAGYVAAKLLGYCRKALGAYFILPNGQIRTIDEVQARRARVNAGVSQQELLDIYSRCRGFLDDAEFVKDKRPWKSWLDRAAALNYPAALAEQAAERHAESLLSGAQSEVNTTPGASESTRDVALAAAESGDPDALFLMADWVTAREGRSQEDTAALISAWQILACQRGYDCGAGSDWIKSVCNWDPQCADGQNYVDYFQRQLGTAYDDALRLADRIAAALARKDRAALQEFF
jgi:hypothetical protein